MLNRKNRVNKPNSAAIVIKIIAAVILLILILRLGIYTVFYAANDSYGISDEELIGWCDSDYREGDFSGLYETLTLFDCYDEEFGLYHEAAESYNTYIEYTQWRLAEEKGIDRADIEAQNRLSELTKRAEKPDFAENKDIIEGFVAEAEKFSAELEQKI